MQPDTSNTDKKMRLNKDKSIYGLGWAGLHLHKKLFASPKKLLPNRLH